MISDSIGRRASSLFQELDLVDRRFLVRRAAWPAGKRSRYKFWEGTEGVTGLSCVGSETVGRAWGRGGYLLRSGRSLWCRLVWCCLASHRLVESSLPPPSDSYPSETGDLRFRWCRKHRWLLEWRGVIDWPGTMLFGAGGCPCSRSGRGGGFLGVFPARRLLTRNGIY